MTAENVGVCLLLIWRDVIFTYTEEHDEPFTKSAATLSFLIPLFLLKHTKASVNCTMMYVPNILEDSV